MGSMATKVQQPRREHQPSNPGAAVDRALPAGKPGGDASTDRGGPPTGVAGRWPPPGTIRDRWTVQDLASLPDDGLTYELVDGLLVVSPAPRPVHQTVVANIHLVLAQACPPQWRVWFAPLDWSPSGTTSFQPDLLVVRRADATHERLTGTPLLVIEVLSPSSEAYDRGMKRDVYAEAGVPQYWIVDPGNPAAEGDAETAPSVEVYDLADDGAYHLQAKASGHDEIAVDGPVEVTLTPADLVA